MNTLTITSADVSEWMRQQLAKVHENERYGQITVFISGQKGDGADAEFSIYLDHAKSSGRKSTIEECLNAVAPDKLSVIAANKRRQAERLLADAEAIEAQAAKL